MRRPLFVVVALVAASCARPVNVEEEKAALLARDAEWATTAADPARRASYLAPDAVVLQEGGPALTGVAAIQASYEGMAKQPGMKLTWKPTRADVAASGDLAYTAGTFEMTATNAAGNPATTKGHYVTTWKKIDGTWKALVDVGTSETPPALSSPHVVVAATAVKWVDPPPSVPRGAKMAAISGDPSKAEPFTIRLQLPAGYKIAPHWLPTADHVTVLSGTFAAGMGKAWDDKAMGDLTAGGYAVMAATMPHFAMAKTAVTLQVHGIGPFVVNYVNAADDPSKK